MSYYIEEVYERLNIGTPDITIDQFSAFLFLTAQAIKSSELENEIVINHFKLADRSRKGVLSREDMKVYITKLYTSICQIIMSEFLIPNIYNNLVKIKDTNPLKNRTGSIYSYNSNVFTHQYNSPSIPRIPSLPELISEKKTLLNSMMSTRFESPISLK